MTWTISHKAGHLACISLLGWAGASLPARAESISERSGSISTTPPRALEAITFTPGQPTNSGSVALEGSQGGEEQQDENGRPVTETGPSPRFNGNIGIDFSSQYIFLGIVNQDEDLTIQPSIDLNYRLYEGKGFISGITATVGWVNYFSTNTDISNPSYTAKNWTETDVNAGIMIEFANRFSFSSNFYDYWSPAGAYREGRYIINELVYDDDGLLSPNFSLKPQLTFLYELPAGGQVGLQPNAWYFEPGLTPTIQINPKSKYPINLAMPLRVGLGNQFYNGTTYGFFSVGPEIEIPLTFLESPGVKWNLRKV